ncbi:hypothetical protein [Bacillus alveayuensis]|uniref:hypothetical protein n=1 Tax=Aeribacillus alveayuensis TaxID=279215 RepID=UPI0005CC93B2|nr:hypothetical protein [Bacillus alveayuensis]
MYTISPFNDALFQYGNRQVKYSSSAFALFPVTAVNIVAGQQKGDEYVKSQKSYVFARKKAVSDEAIDETIAKLTGKGQFINEHV